MLTHSMHATTEQEGQPAGINTPRSAGLPPTQRQALHATSWAPLDCSPHPPVGHVACEWVMSHTSESCHTWMSHIPHNWIMSHDFVSSSRLLSTSSQVTSHISELCRIWVSHVAHGWVMSQTNWAPLDYFPSPSDSCLIWMSHVTYE